MVASTGTNVVVEAGGAVVTTGVVVSEATTVVLATEAASPLQAAVEIKTAAIPAAPRARYI
jgi:hypothetical protein